MLKGSFPQYGIIDLPTAGGKTAWACSLGYMAVSDDYYPDLVRQHRSQALHTMVQGVPFLPVARMVIIATGGSTFDHFAVTLKRLVPKLQEMSPTLEFKVWTTMSKHYSTQVIADGPDNVICFWLIPVAKLNAVSGEHPHVSVAMIIVDEFTVDTPREKSKTVKSMGIKTMIMQATPQRFRMPHAVVARG